MKSGYTVTLAPDDRHDCADRRDGLQRLGQRVSGLPGDRGSLTLSTGGRSFGTNAAGALYNKVGLTFAETDLVLANIMK